MVNSSSITFVILSTVSQANPGDVNFHAAFSPWTFFTNISDDVFENVRQKKLIIAQNGYSMQIPISNRAASQMIHER
jgi:hypothetical protein